MEATALGNVLVQAHALLLFGVAIYVLVEAIRRITGTPEVLGIPMLVVATLGLVVNPRLSPAWNASTG